jgi:putative DNA primase/helicase
MITTNTKTYNFTDSGNAERLVDNYGDMFRYVHERKRFIIWNEKRWEFDTPENTGMLRMAKMTVRGIPMEATSGMEKDEYAKLLAHALRSESEHSLNAMVSLAKNEPTITISVNQLDAKPYLFNIQNGTIDLTTGELWEHDRNDMLTQFTQVIYDKAAQCPKWIEFLNTIQSGKSDVITYLQLLSGYCMTGSTKTQIVPFCHGEGGNGKSTYWKTIRKIFGDYAHEVDPDIFMVNRNNYKDSGTREELANLYGKRLVTAT